MAFQVVVVVLSCCVALAFDCCYFMWLNAVAFHLDCMRKRVELFSDREELRGSSEDEEAPPKPHLARGTAWCLADVHEDGNQHPNSRQIRGRCHQQKCKASSTSKATTKTEQELDATTPLEFLQTIDHHYRHVLALSKAINHLCGLPALVTHASTMTTVLFGLYVCVLMANEPPLPGRDTNLAGLALFVLIFILRIIFVSFDGGQITDRSEALAAAVANMEWLHLPQEAKERREALLQKTSQHIRISAAGIFSINKVNVLNIFSFVLTYLVVLIQ